jgi:RimJ/RimL family protein N-acetyltransferase
MPVHAGWGEQPVLRDDLVLLTSWRLEDAETLVAFDLDPEMRRWFDFPTDAVEGATHRRHAEAVIRRWWAGYVDGTVIAYAVRLSADAAAIGSCELQRRDPGVASISYATLAEHRGRGIAARAARLLAVEGLSTFRFERIELRTDTQNDPSQRVAENAGFLREGVLRASGHFEHHRPFVGSPRDEVVFSLVRADLDRSASSARSIPAWPNP